MNNSRKEKIKVLLLDDEPDFLEQEKLFLKRENNSISVETEVNTDKALEKLKNNNFDCIVSDYQMPNLDGLKFLEKVREGIESDIPFIMFTGKGREEVAMKALNLGADRYLQKGGDPKSQYGVLAQAIKQEVNHYKAEEKLLESEERYRRLFESAQDGMIIINAETGEIRDANPYIQDLTGYSKEELVGKNLWEIGTFRSVAENKDRFEELVEEGYIRYEDLPLGTKEGDEASVEFVSNTYMAGEEKVIQCNIRDISERKNAQEMLRERVKELELLYNLSRVIDSEMSLDDILDNAVNLLPDAWQYPEITSAIINFENNEYKTDNYQETEWCLSSDISIKNEKRGSIQVCYIKEKPTEYEGPFLKEEKKLLEEFAERLSLEIEKLKDKKDIKRSREEYKGLIDSMNDAIWVLDFEGNFLEVNETAVETFGYSREELLSMNTRDIDIGLDPDKITELLEKIEENKLMIFETIQETKSGNKVPVEISSNLITYRGEKAILSVAREITETKKTEKKLESILVNSPNVIIEYDSEGNYKEIYTQNSDKLVATKEEMIGKNVSDFLPQESANKIKEAMEKTLKTNNPQKVRFELQTNGEKKWYSEHYTPIPTKENGSRVVSISRDITDRKEIEEELQREKKKFQEIFNNANDAMFLNEWTKDEMPGKFIEVNETGCEIFGYSREDLLRMTPEDIIAPEKTEELPEQMKELSENGQVRFDSLVKSKKGKEIQVEVHSHLFELEGNERILSIAREITKRKELEDDLRKSREKYRNYVESAPIGVFVANKDGDYIEVNKKACNMTGYSEEELLEKNLIDLIPSGAHEKLKKSLEELFETGKTRVEIPYIRKDGSKRYWTVNGVKLSDRILGFTEDITARKKAENKFKELFSSSPDPIFLVNKNGIIKEVNQAVLEILGYDPKELKGKTISDVPFLPKESKEKLIKNFNKRLEGEEILPYTVKAKTKSGERIFAEINATMISENENQGEIIAIIRDVTKRKELEKKLIEEEEIFQSLTKSIPEVFWLSSVEDYEKMVYVSPAVEEIWGNKPKEFYQNPRLWIDKIHEEDKDRVVEAFDKLVEKGEYFDIKYRIVRDDGSIRWIHDQGFPIYDGEENLVRFAGLAQDITERKDLQEREAFYHSLLRHDIRNKAQIVAGDLELLEDYDLPEKAKKHLIRAEKEIEDSMDLIKKVRTLRSISEEEQLKEINIGSIIKEVVDERRSQAQEKGIKIEYEEIDTKVLGGSLLQELFSNLIENSIKHSNGSKIKITNEETNNKINIMLEDDGKGIPDDEKHKIFDKGFKNKKTGGTGLGMYLVKEIIKNYKANIEVEDSELGGAKFVIELQKP